MNRAQKITHITLIGSLVNLLLTAAKLIAGVIGHSAAMVSDGIHSLSDLISDIVVLIFVKISSKGKDEDHDFGHGKFETFATLLVALLLIIVAVKLLVDGSSAILATLQGEAIAAPSMIALWAAVFSIITKEMLYWYTVKVGREADSPVVIANAWHHRTDAFSSVGSLLGIGGAILLGNRWTVLDPIAGCIISIFIMVAGIKIAMPAVRELLDVSLPKELVQEIIKVAESVDGVDNIHELKTHKNGPSIIIEAHIVVNPLMTVVAAHDISTAVEDALKEHFGNETQISIHIEPDKNAK